MYIDKAQQARVLDSSELWDPRSGKWPRTGRLAHTRYGASAVTLANGRVLVVGGLENWGADLELRTAEIYDPTTAKWSRAGTLATARSGFWLVALADGGALVAGGLGTAAPYEFLSSVERFDLNRSAN